jgi:hypothetical protein
VEHQLKFDKITEYFFSPFNTYIFLNIDEIRYEENVELQGEIIKEMNKLELNFKNDPLKVKWGTESAEKLKISKGVFAPVSKEDSFIMGYLVSDKEDPNSLPIEEKIQVDLMLEALKFSNIKFYIHYSGVAQCSVEVEIIGKEDITILQLETISEQLNLLYKQYFEGISYQIAVNFANTVEKLDVPIFNMEHMPDVRDFSKEDKAQYILPWTHRVYHIHDEQLFNLENPGEPFKFLLTPSKKMDVEDFSIYDNRYIYFGWGHSIIFTKEMDSGFSQTSMEPYDYVRIIEIAQVNWRSVELLDDIVDNAITWFNLHIDELDLKSIKRNIYEIRDFNLTVKRILDNFRDVKITFDTEKRNLLKELNDRWLTSDMYEVLEGKLEMIEDTLEDLFQRQKEKKDDSLNKIVLAFTIISLVDVFSALFEIFSTDIYLSTILQIIVLITGVMGLGVLILLYLRLAEKK